MASASDYAREIREAVGFFQTLRAALIKTGTSGGPSKSERDWAIAQIADPAPLRLSARLAGRRCSDGTGPSRSIVGEMECLRHERNPQPQARPRALPEHESGDGRDSGIRLGTAVHHARAGGPGGNTAWSCDRVAAG
nr:hypothetical protein [Allochromatium palmeri]